MYADWVKSYKNIAEVKRPIPLKTIIGKIPKTLKGCYYKVSPGEFDKYNNHVNHPFDGDGYVSSFRFYDGHVHYQTRFVNTSHRKLEKTFNQRIFTGAFGTKGLLPILKNPANTSIIEWNNELIVFCESGIPYRMDPITLDTIGIIPNFQEGISFRTPNTYINNFLYKIGIIGDIICAHPKIYKGRLIFYSIEYKRNNSCINFYELDKDLNIISKTSYCVKDHLYFIHDFIVTEDYYVFVQHSLKMDLSKLHNGIVNSLVDDTSKTCNFIHAVARPGTNRANEVNEVLPGFITHHIDMKSNYHDNCINLYSIWYPKVISWDKMEDTTQAMLYHTIWDLSSKQITQNVICREWVEFPIYNEINNNVYALMNNDGNTQGSLVKIDINNLNKNDIWFTSNKCFFSEPVIANEYILLTCYNAYLDKSYLYIFNQDITKGPEAICLLPDASPIGLHSFWSNNV